MGDTVLVTGATGFLGARLATLLAARGDQVRVLARATSDLRRLADTGVEIVQGDLHDAASLRAAAQGRRYVFHCAGLVSDWAPRAEFFRVNRDGTQALLAAARQAGAERFVHVSSLTVLGLPRRGAALDEDSPVDRGAKDPYTASKLAGEDAVRAAGAFATVVRPGVIWGPGDAAILPRIAALVKQGRMPLLAGGRNVLGLSHVDNLSRGLMLAAAAPQAAGRLYHVTDGEEITARVALEEIARVQGVPPPRLSLPFGVAYALAALLEAGARLAGRRTPPALTRYGVRLVACDARWDLARARRELGYEPVVRFRDGIAAAVGGIAAA